MSDVAKNTWLIARHEFVEEVRINSADITGTAAGKFGHANGYPLVTISPECVGELLSVLLFYDFKTAAYGAGGNITINESGGGAAVTGLISAANSVGAAVDKIVQFNPTTTAAKNLTAGLGWSLVSSAAFTQPGTAAGTIRCIVRYRKWNTGL